MRVMQQNLADLTKEDSIVLNLQRACEAAINLAMHLVRVHRLGLPQESRDAFDMLMTSSRLEAELGNELKRMGFRDVAVHDYTRLSLDIVRSIIEHKLDLLLAFAIGSVKTST